MIRLKGPRHSSHNPLDGLRVQPWIRFTISTSPRNQKRKIPHLESMSCYLIMCKWLRGGCLLKQQEGCCRSLRLCIGCPMKMVRPGKAASCSTHRHRQMRKGKGWGQHSGQRFNTTTSTGETRKKAGCSLYLNELLIQKCKFRHRFTVNC